MYCSRLNEIVLEKGIKFGIITAGVTAASAALAAAAGMAVYGGVSSVASSTST